MINTQFPTSANWDLNYACQLRCAHCYTEAGRRKERRLSFQQMCLVVDALTSMPLSSVQISGGEPTLVPELPEVLKLLRNRIPSVEVYTNACDFSRATASSLLTHATRIHISLDGPNPAINDPIRGVPGAFDRTMAGLSLLDELAKEMRSQGLAHAALGIDTVLVRSNLASLDAICTDVINAFETICFFRAGTAIPSGLAAEPGYAQSELLGGDELESLRDPSCAARLAALSPRLSMLRVTDNFGLLFSPENIASNKALTMLMHIEANGDVRMMPTCEGTVGNILSEPPELLWQRVQESWRNPFVVQQLAGVRTMQEWARAAYAIDRYFASPDNLVRLAARTKAQSSAKDLSHEV